MPALMATVGQLPISDLTMPLGIRPYLGNNAPVTSPLAVDYGKRKQYMNRGLTDISPRTEYVAGEISTSVETLYLGANDKMSRELGFDYRFSTQHVGRS